ncbi:MAG: RnfABCDGE type electron transport complex subunit D [Clostridia bacterium]|nr:RnfABCDGE type electron transport complex subunit D [Clostridia bacterium]
MMNKLLVSSSPHLRTPRATGNIMREVFAALLPAAVCGCIIHGFFHSFLLLFAAVASAMLAEAAAQRLLRRPITVKDGSAALCGLLLGMNMPPGVPLWMPVVGSVIAIVLVKQLFGGIGYNFMNPALAARAALTVSWPAIMTAFPGVDAIAQATPLASPGKYSIWQLLLGTTGGSIGETCRALLLLGAVFLIIRRVINWRIPVIYLLSYMLFDRLFGNQEPILHMVFSGGLILGACFMATDYTTSPITGRGRVVYAAGCGLVTAALRVFGGSVEGVSFAILIMNLLVPLIERIPARKPFGGGAFG